MSKARRTRKISDSPYSSPHRPRNKQQTAQVIYQGETDERDRLQARLDALLHPSPPSEPAVAAADPERHDQWIDIDEPSEPLPEAMDTLPSLQTDQPPPEPADSSPGKGKSKRRILPNAADYRLYYEWMNIIPTLVDDYLEYTKATMGQPIGLGPEEIYRKGCVCDDEKLKSTTITCIYVDCEWHYQYI